MKKTSNIMEQSQLKKICEEEDLGRRSGIRKKIWGAG